MFVCLSPGGQSLTVGESAKDKLLVGTVNGVFSFGKNNGGWNQQETMLPDQHISAIIFEPSTQTLFAGSYNGKIFASGDSGKSWEQRDQGIGGKEIYSLASQLVGGKPRVYAGTQPAHLYLQRRPGKELDGASRPASGARRREVDFPRPAPSGACEEHYLPPE